jgi:hypothetical protein
MQDHPHIRKILDSTRLFREGRLGVADLQQTLSAIRTAIEGDMPAAAIIRQAIRDAEYHIEIAWFTMEQAEQAVEINKILNELESIVLKSTMAS